MPADLDPEEGLRLMTAFANIRRRSHREIVLNLAIALANSEERAE